MFNLNIICLISCLVVVATAQFFSNVPKELEGHAKYEAINILWQFFQKHAHNTNIFKVVFFDKVESRPLDGGPEYTYHGFIEHNQKRTRRVTIVLQPDTKYIFIKYEPL